MVSAGDCTSPLKVAKDWVEKLYQVYLLVPPRVAEEDCSWRELTLSLCPSLIRLEVVVTADISNLEGVSNCASDAVLSLHDEVNPQVVTKSCAMTVGRSFQ